MDTKNIPEKLLASLKGLPGFDETAFINIHTSGETLTSIRLNPLKPSNAFADEEKIPWCANGRYLKERPSFTADPLFHAGCYYVQEASSMFIAHLIKETLDLSRPLRVLDLCAAPGGKSTLIASLLSKDSLLVANEVIRTRVNILADNLTRWGNANVVVTNNDPSHFQKLENYFDLIVADAPCSGSGLFRKQEDAADEWSEENVHLCGQRQQRILGDVMPALKPGGILIYSTCSYSKSENEDIADKLMDDHELESITVNVDPSWKIIEAFSDKHKAKGSRFYPYRTKGEGFFAAAFRKKGFGEADLKRTPPLKKIASADEIIVSRSLKYPSNYFLFKHQEDILAIPHALLKDIPQLQDVLHLKKAGVTIGRITNGELIPDHQFALSGMLNDTVPRVNVDRATALKYLKREDIKLPDTEKGWTLICFEDHPMGWAKILPNRVNNYYPKELRILKNMNE